MPTSSLPILIIEDSPEDFEALVRAFGKAGVLNPIYRFSYGEDAFDFLKQRGRYFKHGDEARPGLLILDLNLPGTDGMKILAEIRADPALKPIPVVVLSTSSSAREIEDAYAAGANSYIVKPSGPEEFVDVVRRLKDYWLGVVTLPGQPDTLDVVVPRPLSTSGRPPQPPPTSAPNP